MKIEMCEIELPKIPKRFVGRESHGTWRKSTIEIPYEKETLRLHVSDEMWKPEDVAVRILDEKTIEVVSHK